MRAVSVAVATGLAFASNVAAVSWGSNYGVWKSPNWSWNNGNACMTDTDAQKVADNFAASIANYSTALANSAFTTDFEDFSDSVIELIDSGCPNQPIPLGVPTFDSLAAFEQGQGSQPPIPFKQLNLWHNCETVTLRWMSTMSPSNVTGIIVLETHNNNGTWLIQKVFSEFNSGAWLVDLGVFKPTNCTGGNSTHARRA